MRSRTETPSPAPGAADPDARSLQQARRRFARRQWARRWLAWRVVVAVLAVLVLVGGATWLVFFSATLSVSGVQVEGTAVLDSREVQRVAAVPTGSPLATVDLAAVADRVEELAPVSSVDVSRAWPDQVRIDVTERQAVAVVERDGVLHGVDEEGVLFRRYPSRPPSLPLVRSGPDTPPAAVAEAATVVDALPGPLAARVDFVSVRTVDTISLQLRDGTTVVWGSAEDSADKARVLEVLLKQKASQYDVSVPGQPVIRP
ncbi:cell division protein FtsQ/DivIB [Nocardioides mesophilus]|uniref:Cell division protein FtsQ n=1 Tax=Nocardioides mesophilus TaxID=433659 RepID=A0A7G9RBW3_9ACTN|nr:FtsQ-type POTRA domain-containing protein [Nocardioides mesophilus]QNN53088.1 FtsQ-type POTRA domain-containing protein [Nocardioides mesophilus]